MLNGALIDHSGALGTSGAHVAAAAQNRQRRYLFIQNISANDIWVNFDTNATTDEPSFKIATMASMTWDHFVPTGSIDVIGTVTGQKFVIKVAE